MTNEEVISNILQNLKEHQNVDINYLIKCVKFFRDIIKLCIDTEEEKYIRNFISPTSIMNSIENDRKPEDVFWALLLQ